MVNESETLAGEEAAPPPAEVAPPLENGRFRLLKVLGQGGMATVFKAFDTRLDVHRAIKILAPHMAERPAIRTRFEMEAKILARLRHPNLVTVYDFGCDGDRLYIIMELVDGCSLADLVDERGPLDPTDAIRITRLVLAALGVAHAQKMVHRDVKPHNVLLDSEGQPKLLDFGIARVDTADLRLTHTNATMGTIAYMAPEQFHTARSADARADIYGIASTLYHITLGKDPPFLHRVEWGDSAFRGIPPRLAEVIYRASRGNPDERYASTAEMSEALAGALDDLESPRFADTVATSNESPPGYPTPRTQVPVSTGSSRQTGVPVTTGASRQTGVPVTTGASRQTGVPVTTGASRHTGDPTQAEGAVRAGPILQEGGVVQASSEPTRPFFPGIGATGRESVAVAGPPTDRTMDSHDSLSLNESPTRSTTAVPTTQEESLEAPAAKKRASRRWPLWAAIGLVLFAGLVFLRPQDTLREKLGWLHDLEIGPEVEDPNSPKQPTDPLPPPLTEPVEVAAPTPSSTPSPPVTSSVPTRPVTVATPVATHVAPVAAPIVPVAAPVTPAPTPPVAQTGVVKVTGDVLGAKLRGADGRDHGPGELAVGTYSLRVAFPGGSTIELPGYVKIKAGQTVTVRCDSTAQQCR